MTVEVSKDPRVDWQALARYPGIVPVACFVALAASVVSNVFAPGAGAVLASVYVCGFFFVAGGRCLEFLVIALLFQNVIIALSMGDRSLQDLNVARATNFIMCASLWALCTLFYLRDWHNFNPTARAVMGSSYLLIALIACYFAYGYQTGGAPAVTYLRNYLMPLLCLQASIYASHFSPPMRILWVGRMLLLYCFAEIAFGGDFVRFVSGDIYLADGKDLLENSPSHTTDAFVVQFFNTPLLGELGDFHRLNGPNLHPISLGYALATFALFCFVRRRYLEMLTYFPPIFFAGSKGALSYFLFAFAAISIARKFRHSGIVFAIAVVLALYCVVVYSVGKEIGDYHVLGLIGSVRGFLENPLGRGLGAGGNLSGVLTVWDWQRAQYQGYTDIAVESAIGVILYQMGVNALAFVAFYAWVGWLLWANYLATNNQVSLLGAFAIPIALANGLFHEEALFAPLCLGLIVLVVGPQINRAVGTLDDRRKANP